MAAGCYYSSTMGDLVTSLIRAYVPLSQASPAHTRIYNTTLLHPDRMVRQGSSLHKYMTRLSNRKTPAHGYSSFPTAVV